jgi:Uma2 family endonuclease
MSTASFDATLSAMTIGASVNPSGQAISLEAWANLSEDSPGELVDGTIVEEEVASIEHEAVVSWLFGALRSWAAERGGRVFGSELKLAVSPRRGRKADLVMYLPGTPLPHRRATLVTEPPSVVIEIISPDPRDAQRDRVQKLAEYADFGIPFYWLVDPERRVLEVLELDRGRGYRIALAAGGGVHAVPGCAELQLDLDDLWRELDELPAE